MERVHLLPGFAIFAREACSKLVAQAPDGLGECNRKYLAEDLTILGMDSLIDLVSNIKATLVSAADPANDRDKLNTTLQQYLSQLQSGVTGTSFSGENWLYNNNSVIPDTRSVIGGYIRGANGQFYPQNISFPSSSLVMPSLLSISATRR